MTIHDSKLIDAHATPGRRTRDSFVIFRGWRSPSESRALRREHLRRVGPGAGGAPRRFRKIRDERGLGPVRVSQLGKAGIAGIGPDTFNRPSAVVTGRILIFDQEGNQLAEWRQFGPPSGIYIDRNDNIYVTDNQSDAKRNPGMKRGIRIGTTSDGVVKATIRALGPDEAAAAPEGSRRQRKHLRRGSCG